MKKILLVLLGLLLALPTVSYAGDDSVAGKSFGNLSGVTTVVGIEEGTTNNKFLLTDSSGYLKVNLAVGGLSGSTTPSDNLATPTNAVNSATFLMGYDTSTWDVLRTIAVGENVSNGLLAIGVYGYDPAGGNWDRVEVDPNGSWYVNQGALDHSTDNVAIIPHNDITTAYITTATSTTVKSSAGDLIKVIVGVAGAASTTAILYNDADCASLPTAFATLDTSSVGVWPISIPFSAGLCVVTNGTPTITVVYK